MPDGEFAPGLEDSGIQAGTASEGLAGGREDYTFTRFLLDGRHLHRPDRDLREGCGQGSVGNHRTPGRHIPRKKHTNSHTYFFPVILETFHLNMNISYYSSAFRRHFRIFRMTKFDGEYTASVLL